MDTTRNYETMRVWAMNPVLTGKQIKIFRRRLHFSQDQLLDALWDIGEEISRNSLSNWETGKKRPTLDHLLALCHIFNCTLNELVVTNLSSRNEEEGDQPVPYYEKIFGHYDSCMNHLFKTAALQLFFYCHANLWLVLFLEAERHNTLIKQQHADQRKERENGKLMEKKNRSPDRI